MAQTVPGNAHPTVNLTPVDTRTDRVLHVLQVIWAIIVPQVILSKNICVTNSFFKVLVKD